MVQSNKSSNLQNVCCRTVRITCCVFVLILQQYDQELFKLALPCLSAVAGALPPDYMESSSLDMIEKHSCVDAERNFTLRPADTTR